MRSGKDTGMPYSIIYQSDVREVAPYHWVSDAPKGGHLVLNFGFPTELPGVTAGLANTNRAVVAKSVLDQWAADLPPFSFKWRTKMSWDFSFLGANEPFLSWAPGQRYVSPGPRLRCFQQRSPARENIQKYLGSDGYREWAFKTQSNFYASLHTDRIPQNVNPNQWIRLNDWVTSTFDAGICDTDLTFSIEFKEFKELRLDHWDLEAFQAADPDTVQPCS